MVPMTMGWRQDSKAQLLAAFLIVRGPYAYMGYGWQGQPLPPWEPMWDQYDVGEPTNMCTQTPSGVYYRNYTKGSAVLDCSSWTAQLNF